MSASGRRSTAVIYTYRVSQKSSPGPKEEEEEEEEEEESAMI